MTEKFTRKLRKGPHSYLIIQLPSKTQYKHSLTTKDLAIIEDGDDEVLIRIKKQKFGVREYGEKNTIDTSEMVQIVEG
jgi:hypothetical protein